MKKFACLLILAMLAAGAVFAQEESDGVLNNWISGEVNVFGGGFRYEYAFNPSLSLGFNTYASTMVFFYEIGADIAFRFYPGGKVFFLGLGAGYHWHMEFFGGVQAPSNAEASLIAVMRGFAVTPDIGFKIDVGKKGGFFLSPGIKVPITIGRVGEISAYEGFTDEIGVKVGVVPYFAFGGAF